MSGIMKGKRGLIMGVANDHSIAWGIAKALAAEGADVAITYEKSAERAAEVVGAIKAKGRRAVAIQADSADAVQAAYSKLGSSLGRTPGKTEVTFGFMIGGIVLLLAAGVASALFSPRFP